MFGELINSGFCFEQLLVQIFTIQKFFFGDIVIPLTVLINSLSELRVNP